MSKIVAADMDGTILKRGESALSFEVIETVKRLDNKEIVTVISSGRAPEQMLDMFSFKTYNLWLSCLDGAIVYKDKKVVFGSYIDSKIAEKIINSLKSARNTNVLIQKERKTQKISEITDFDGILRISVFGENAIFDGKKATHAYESEFVSATVNGGWYEINAFGTDKGAALLKIAQICGIEDITAFGDNYNDIPMFRAAAVSYAVKNSPPGVISAADRVTDNPIKTIGSEFL